MNRTKKSSSSKKAGEDGKILNSYGYDVSKFNVLDILPVRRDHRTGRLVSTGEQPSKKNSWQTKNK